MATITAKETWNKENIKKEYGRLHDFVLDISEESVELTVENIEKWQKLFSKSITKSTPLVEKGIDLTFEVAETIFKQYSNGEERVKSLLGIGTKKAKKTKIKKSSPKITPTKVSAKKTKLTDIGGIGPKIEGLLVKQGISSISLLAKSDIKTLDSILDEAGPRFQMHDPKTWIEQANALLN